MAIPWIQTSFANGEIAPALFGHVDLARLHTAAATMRNMFVGYRGGSYSRPGTRYVLRSKQDPVLGQAIPQMVPFSFSLDQNYVLEFGDNYVRFIVNGGFATEATTTISGATQANPCVITDIAHGYTTGDWVSLASVVGMTQLNGNTYVVTVLSANTFSLTDLNGAAVNSTGFGAYTSGGTAARIYEISSPYSGSDLDTIKWTQSADVLTITSPNFPPYNLSRFGPLNWTLTPISFGSSIPAPGNAAARATVNPSGATTPPTLPAAFAYVVTAIDPKTGEESVASPIANVTNSVDISLTAGSIITDWAAVAGAGSYNIYKAPISYNTDPGNTTDALPVPAGALFGLAGSSFGTEFVDSNITADFIHTPPKHQNPFAVGAISSITLTSSSADWTTATAVISTSTGSGFVGQCVIVNSIIVAVIIVNAGANYAPTDTVSFSGGGSSAAATLNVGPQSGTYPSVVTYFQQRRVYSSSLNQPDTYWMSQPGAFDNFDTSIPTIPSDSITGTPWSEKVDGVKWMVEMPLGLLTFTGSAVWQVTSTSSGNFISSPAAITPDTQGAVPQSSIGSSSVLQPIRINWDIIYAEPDDATVRAISYQLYFNIYTGVDISWPSSHMLSSVGRKIVGWAWCRKPNYLLWAARDDGVLLSLTFLKEQEVQGWARHTTQGQVRRLCSITELPVDALYLCVERVVNNSTGISKYFIERMDDRIWLSGEDDWAVDCGVGTILNQPDATLYMGATSGSNAPFFASGIFTAGMVGWTIRAGGGIAVVTSFIDASNVRGTWVFPNQQTVPDSGVAMPQTSGMWSIAPQVGAVSGLWHLAGQTLVGLADGVPLSGIVVSATGIATLPFTASDVKLGLGFTAQLQSVYLDTGQPTIQGRRKAITAVTVRCEASAPMFAGANQVDTSALSPPPLAVAWTQGGVAGLAATPITTVLPATYTSPGGQTVQPPFTGDIRIPIPANWQKPGQVAAQQTKPQALNVLAFVPETVPGDIPEDGYTARRGQRQAA